MIPTSRANWLEQWLPRFGLRTIMLLIAAIAAWTAYFTGKASIQRDTTAIESMYTLSPQLLVRKNNEYACIQIERYDGVSEYQCYVPPDHNYELHLVWSKPFSQFEKKLKPEISAPLLPGKHQITLKQSSDKLLVSVDGVEVMNEPRQRPELSTGFSAGGGSRVEYTVVSSRFQSQWYPLGEPLTLLRQFSCIDGQPGSARWTALWIDIAK